MRKLIMSLALVSTVAIAAPASAQYRHGNGQNVQAQINQIENRIDRAASRRIISKREAFALRREANQVERLFGRYRRDGLSRLERRDIERRLNVLEQRVRTERRDRNNRPGR